jgi:hypothetical protein
MKDVTVKCPFCERLFLMPRPMFFTERERTACPDCRAEALRNMNATTQADDPLTTIASLRRKGWNAAIERAAAVAEHYARLMNSQAAQRAADEIRTLASSDRGAASGDR